MEQPYCDYAEFETYCHILDTIIEDGDCSKCDKCNRPTEAQKPEAVLSSSTVLLSCAHCGGTINHRTLLGETIFSCSNCSAETRFKKEGMTVANQMEKFKRRAT